LGLLVAVALISFMAIVRLGWERSTMIPIGFGVPIVIVSYFRSRALLWGTVVAFTIVICIKFFGPHSKLIQTEPAFTPAESAVLLELDLLLIALMGHIWISLQTTAEDASIRKTRFLAAVSHDVRTPANAISLLADLIRRTAANPALAGEIPELAQELYASSVSLVNLLNDVLDIARFDSGRLESRLAEFSLPQMLEEERNRLTPLVRQKNLAYVWAPPPEPIWLRADRIKLSRIVGNLIGNAVKFTEQGEVRLEAEKCADGSVEIRVKDTGVGIALEHQKHIFDEFFQLRNPERDRNKGSGLGLAICKRLVDAMGAKIQVESSPGHGSTFVITLPATDVIQAPAGSTAS
jgi:signal transduction histidine kinase